MESSSRLVNRNSDTWHLSEEKQIYPFTFEFGYYPNKWFKEKIKQITEESINTDKITLSTIHRYHSGLKVFFQFLDSVSYSLETFADLTPRIAEEFLHYLLLNVKSNSTRAVKLSALKYYLNYGRILGHSGFPMNDIFDGTEFRYIKTEDTLKSKLIEDRILKQIDEVLDRLMTKELSYDEHLIWGIITIIRHTGMRIHEALNIQESFIGKDLMGKPILEVRNDKTKTDRYIPVNPKVIQAIRHVAKVTKEVRNHMRTDDIFVRPYLTGDRTYDYLESGKARNLLENFLIKQGVLSSTGEPVNITFHQFRHTIGTDLLNNGMSMREVMDYLGHSSPHSTRLYAKVLSSRFGKAYRDLGFIGVIRESLDDITDEQEQKITKGQRLMAQLPDGVCARPIKEKVINCKKPNACLFCPKFITTPEFLEFHKGHLERIRADKARYVEENLIGTDYLLEETEKVLEGIVSQLEKIQNERGEIN